MDIIIKPQNQEINELIKQGLINKENENSKLLEQIKQGEPNENFWFKAAEEYYNVAIDINSIILLTNINSS